MNFLRALKINKMTVFTAVAGILTTLAMVIVSSNVQTQRTQELLQSKAKDLLGAYQIVVQDSASNLGNIAGLMSLMSKDIAHDLDMYHAFTTQFLPQKFEQDFSQLSSLAVVMLVTRDLEDTFQQEYLKYNTQSITFSDLPKSYSKYGRWIVVADLPEFLDVKQGDDLSVDPALANTLDRSYELGNPNLSITSLAGDPINIGVIPISGADKKMYASIVAITSFKKMLTAKAEVFAQYKGLIFSTFYVKNNECHAAHHFGNESFTCQSLDRLDGNLLYEQIGQRNPELIHRIFADPSFAIDLDYPRQFLAIIATLLLAFAVTWVVWFISTTRDRLAIDVENKTSKLLLNEKLLNAINEDLQQFFVSVDSPLEDGPVDPALKKLLGFKDSENISLSFIKSQMHSADIGVYDEFLADIEYAIRNEKKDFLVHCRARLKHRHGHYLWFDHAFRGLYENDKFHFIASVKNIDADVKREGSLIDALSTRTNLLQRMNHEFRTPMNGIMGINEMLLDKAEGTDKNLLLLSQHSAQRLFYLIEDLLDTASFDRGEVNLSPAPFDVRRLIKEVEIRNQFIAQDNDNDLTINLSDQVPDIMMGDALRIKQILVHLIGNAIKFTKHGSVRVNVNVVNISESAQNLIVTIKDTGIGIARDKLVSIMRQFEQVEMDYSRSFDGAGLGLYICRTLVDAMGGSLSIDSELNQGTTAILCIPLPTISQQRNVNRLIGAKDLKGIAVAYVSTDKLDDLVLSTMLEHHGASVRHLQSVDDLIDFMEIHTVDLVLTDMILDKSSAIKLQDMMRLHGFNTVPIIGMSNEDPEQAKEMALISGFDGFIHKPILESALIAEIHSLLGKKLKIPK